MDSQLFGWGCHASTMQAAAKALVVLGRNFVIRLHRNFASRLHQNFASLITLITRNHYGVPFLGVPISHSGGMAGHHLRTSLYTGSVCIMCSRKVELQMKPEIIGNEGGEGDNIRQRRRFMPLRRCWDQGLVTSAHCVSAYVNSVCRYVDLPRWPCLAC